MKLLENLRSLLLPHQAEEYDPERALYVPGRRRFLVFSGAALAGTMIGGRLFGRMTDGAPLLATQDPNTFLTPTWVTRELARSFADSLRFGRLRYVPCAEGVRLGDVVGGTQITKQLYAPMEPIEPTTDIEVARAQIRSIAGALARRVENDGLKTLTDLPLSKGGASGHRVHSRELGVALRLVEQYDMETDRKYWRVDLAGGRA